MTLLYGCSGGNVMTQNQQTGTVIGALAGGIIGSQFGDSTPGKIGGAAIGASVGSMIGNKIGKDVDNKGGSHHSYQNEDINRRNDEALMVQSRLKALEYSPSGKSVQWRNKDSGNYGYVKVVRTYFQPNSGDYCRDFIQTCIMPAFNEEIKTQGTACKSKSGVWEILE